MSTEPWHVKLRRLMESTGDSEPRLAAVLGCQPSTVHKWKNGKGEPSIEQLARIADHYQISLDQFMRPACELPAKVDRSFQIRKASELTAESVDRVKKAVRTAREMKRRPRAGPD